jgi:hypothetical protein
MDDKYGQLYTAADVRKIVAAYTAADEGDLHDDKEFESILSRDDYQFDRDMPLFLLIAKDDLAADTIEDYHASGTLRELPQEWLDKVWAQRERFDEFRAAEEAEQQKHDDTEGAEGRPSRMKMPD